MMKNYLYVSKNKNQKSPKSAFLLLIIIFILLIVLLGFRYSVFSMFTSWWGGEASFLQSSAVATNWFGDKVQLANEISGLKNKNSDLEVKVIELESKANAYDDLVYEIGTSTKSKGTLAKIIRRPPFTIFDTYLVDKGSVDGINVGDKVYARDIYVGSVKSVTNNNSLINLYSSPGEKVLVNFGTSSTQYEAYGVGNGTLKSDVPRDIEVESGMSVNAGDRDVTLYGKVSAIDKESDNTNKSIFISIPFDIHNTAWFVIKSND